MGPALRGTVVMRGGQSRVTLRRDVGDAVPYEGGQEPCEKGRRGRRPLHALSLRGAKRRGNPFSFLGRIPTPVCGGAHGPRPTGRSGHVGRTESPAGGKKGDSALADVGDVRGAAVTRGGQETTTQ